MTKQRKKSEYVAFESAWTQIPVPHTNKTAPSITFKTDPDTGIYKADGTRVTFVLRGRKLFSLPWPWFGQ